MCTVFENHRKSLIVSEANYVYILSGQKFIKNAKNAQFGECLKKSEACGQTVLPDKNWRKMSKLKHSNETFWAIFKQCDVYFE